MESAGDVGDAGLVTIVFAAVLCLAIAGLMLEVVLAGGLVSAAPIALGIGSGAPSASCFVCITLAGGGSGGLTGLGMLAAALGAGSSNGVLGCTSGVNSGTLRVEGSGGTHSVFQDPTLHVGRGEAPTGNNSLFTAPFVLLPATVLGCGHFAFLLGRGAGLGAGSGDGFQGSVSAVDARENSAGEMDSFKESWDSCSRESPMPRGQSTGEGSDISLLSDLAGPAADGGVGDKMSLFEGVPIGSSLGAAPFQRSKNCRTSPAEGL